MERPALQHKQDRKGLRQVVSSKGHPIASRVALLADGVTDERPSLNSVCKFDARRSLA